jgi:hypothetical protein
MTPISIDEYFGRMSHITQPPEDVRTNAAELLERVNTLLAIAAVAGLPEAAEPHVNSGWRSAEYNARVPNAAPRSKHITGQAVDIADPEGALDNWCVTNLHELEAAGLWLEHPLATKGWCHLQSVAPRSGSRMFYP